MKAKIAWIVVVLAVTFVGWAQIDYFSREAKFEERRDEPLLVVEKGDVGSFKFQNNYKYSHGILITGAGAVGGREVADIVVTAPDGTINYFTTRHLAEKVAGQEPLKAKLSDERRGEFQIQMIRPITQEVTFQYRVCGCEMIMPSLMCWFSYIVGGISLVVCTMIIAVSKPNRR